MMAQHQTTLNQCRVNDGPTSNYAEPMTGSMMAQHQTTLNQCQVNDGPTSNYAEPMPGQ